MQLERLLNRRSDEIYLKTRTELLTSMGAAAFFIAVIMWRFGAAQSWLPYYGLAAVALWIGVSAYRFRDRIWRRPAISAGTMAATGVDHYRTELTTRREHLRSGWIWLGPILLAILMTLAILVERTSPRYGQLRNAWPFVVLSILWTISGIAMRRRQALALQREIDELDN